jgi:putative membrane-bound dehydrogenase-like protein
MLHAKILAGSAVFLNAASLFATELTLRGRTFSFPDGYVLSEAATPPLVDRPIEACFDNKGRLYVTESSGSNEPVQQQLEKKPHRVLRLADSDGDGSFDQRTVFADNLMFPAGCLWQEGSLYVAAPPVIWKLTDADDDGSAERRGVWFDGKTLTGCANDLHGPYAGPGNKLYWCKGAFAEQRYDLPGKPGWTTRAAHVFRADAGSGRAENIECVFTAGMDNPVGLAWTPEEDLIVSGTFFQHPGGGQRDGLIHAVHGGVWGKDHAVLDGHPRTGELMPPMTHLGPAAPCGMIRYGRDLLVCQFNLRKVSRHALHPLGASYRTDDSDFLTCDHPDFHPTDVLQDADGSVLVIDTGGWYKLCCPTSQLAKPNVLGAIYRLRQKGGEVPVRTPAPQRTPLPVDDAKACMAGLTATNPHTRRAAAALLGRGRVAEAVPALLTALAHTGGDRFLFHAYCYALLEIGDAAQTRRGLTDADPVVQAGALYALEQLPAGKPGAEETLRFLTNPDDFLRQAGLFVLGRHPDWADAAAPWIGQQLALPESARGPSLPRVLEMLGAAPGVQELMGRELTRTPSQETRTMLLEVMGRLHPSPWPEAWHAPLEPLLTGAPTALTPLALDLVRQMPPTARIRYAPLVEKLAADTAAPRPLRLKAAASLSSDEAGTELFELAAAALTEPAMRMEAALLLFKKKLSPPQLLRLTTCFGTVGLLERPLLLGCFRGQTDEAAGLALVAALEKNEAMSSLPADTLLETFEKFPASVREALGAALGKLKTPDQTARLDALEKDLPAGDIERGSVVFQSAKASCATCHPIGYKGGHLGPDLSKVGAVRTRRDLLEAIVYPHASFVRSFEPVLLTRQDDSLVYGIVTDQSGEGVTITTGAAGPVIRVAQADIKSLAPGKFSLMPQGLDLVLTPQELADVVAFLQSSR